MTLRLELRAAPEVPVEADCITPDRLRQLPIAEIERLPVFYGNRQVPLAEVFTVSGAPGETIQLRGDMSRVKHIGATMSCGQIHIDGHAGAHLGAEMLGGTIVVSGNAGDWVGPEMRGGRIVIRGSAGHLAGSAYRGAAVGMTGGEIIIHGAARNEAGHGMRGGLIAIGGSCGDFAGVNMLAGTVTIFGAAGIRTGAGMKRGTIIAMQPLEVLPTFAYACEYRPSFLPLYLLHLRRLGLPVTDGQLSASYRRWCGDAVELNRGEILSPSI
ncbi:MAG: formylmethanofuran dehydrogenase subunit C [Gammaproteobacteria bacterium]|nr:formylmethanofuran dehydrogenase subunit C [Gammaproteobacteria bacterium]